VAERTSSRRGPFHPREESIRVVAFTPRCAHSITVSKVSWREMSVPSPAAAVPVAIPIEGGRVCLSV
jgi:hypothetical protein